MVVKKCNYIKSSCPKIYFLFKFSLSKQFKHPKPCNSCPRHRVGALQSVKIKAKRVGSQIIEKFSQESKKHIIKTLRRHQWRQNSINGKITHLRYYLHIFSSLLEISEHRSCIGTCRRRASTISRRDWRYHC